ncbi:hypothetical protein WR52_28845 (plasmid) [Bacillus cereus]|nr:MULTISPECIES: hypothetical protein [Bacillus cereus group]ANC22740.1 hypothetical protein WR52_28845 [Bacillus cereus]HDR8042554.1 hypothetical protein [Bacillus cereus]HEF1897971.1 hypothetical protein [Bacillus cereus]
MKIKLTGVLVATLALMILPTGAKAFSDNKTTVVTNEEVASRELKKIAAEKRMTVTLPSNGSFAVYDEKGVCVNFTILSGNNKVKLPKNGTIVFAGAPNSEFAISMN